VALAVSAITAGLPAEPGQVALVEAMVHLAGRIDSAVVAEGVESDAELVALRQLGVGFAQGNLLARRRAARASPRSWRRSTGGRHLGPGPRGRT
jgi:EAL domain-containing protein (putative c-di-GMP-specific phosphodiesterase class I)